MISSLLLALGFDDSIGNYVYNQITSCWITPMNKHDASSLAANVKTKLPINSTNNTENYINKIYDEVVST